MSDRLEIDISDPVSMLSAVVAILFTPDETNHDTIVYNKQDIYGLAYAIDLFFQENYGVNLDEEIATLKGGAND